MITMQALADQKEYTFQQKLLADVSLDLSRLIVKVTRLGGPAVNGFLPAGDPKIKLLAAGATRDLRKVLADLAAYKEELYKESLRVTSEH
jgi:hypothetical protein